ncbi:MAG: TetR/AcrR family transcriptional regulator [Actinomycetota bacterium]
MARTPSSELEANILRAAADLLAEVGAGGLTQRAVATAADVSPQSLYNRFASKHDLLDAVANDGFELLVDHLRNEGGVPLETIEDPIDNIVEGLGRYRRFAMANPRRYGVMFDADVPGFRVSDRTLDTAFTSLSVLVDAVASAMEAGRLDEGEPLQVAQMLWAAAHGALRFELTEVGFVDDWAAHYDSVVTAMLRGLGSG